MLSPRNARATTGIFVALAARAAVWRAAMRVGGEARVGPADVGRPEQSRPLRRRLWVLTGAIAVCLTLASLELLSYGFFLSRELLDRDLRVFCPPKSGGMPLAVKPRFVQRWNTGQFDIEIRTNSIGLREDFELPDDRRVDVGFLGDSFTFGHGVQSGERYSDLVRSRLDGRLVASFAYLDGFTTPHYYLFLKEHPGLVPRVAVVGLYLGNDLTGDMMESELVTSPDGELTQVVARYREPDDLGRLVTRDRNPVNRLLRRTWSGQLMLYLDRQLPLNLRLLRPDAVIPIFGWIRQDIDLGELDDPARLALAYVAKIRDLVRAAGGETVVVLIPPAFYVDARYASFYPPDVTARIQTGLPLVHAVEEWCRAEGLVCVDPIEELRRAERAGTRTYFSIDPHWTPAGHRAAALAVLPAVSQALAAPR